MDFLPVQWGLVSTAHSKRGEHDVALAAMAGNSIIYTTESTKCSGERYKPQVISGKAILSGDWSLPKMPVAVILRVVVFLLKKKIF